MQCSAKLLTPRLALYQLSTHKLLASFLDEDDSINCEGRGQIRSRVWACHIRNLYGERVDRTSPGGAYNWACLGHPFHECSSCKSQTPRGDHGIVRLP